MDTLYHTDAVRYPNVRPVAEWVWLWDRFTLCGLIVDSSVDQGGCIICSILRHLISIVS